MEFGSTLHGNLFAFPDGTFQYNPDQNFAGFDSFTYEVSDGKGHTVTGTVKIKVSIVAPNHQPTAGDDSFTTAKDQVLSVDAPGILANDSDPRWRHADGDLSHSATRKLGY